MSDGYTDMMREQETQWDKLKLSPAQKRAMRKMSYEYKSAYSLGVGLNTLRVLWRKGLIIGKVLQGCYSDPRNRILYKLTQKGATK